jgi:hypothetical protein
VSEHIPAKVYLELGRAGLSDHEADSLIADAGRLAGDQHQMGARGKVPIKNTKRVLVYDSGIDGMDFKVYIEDAEAKTADALVREVLDLLHRHRNSATFGYGSGPNLSEWEADARRYLDNEQLQKLKEST